MRDHTQRARPFRLVAFEPSEFEIHVSLVEALHKFAMSDCLWLHIGNGERRDVVTSARLERMGVRRGAADLLFIRPGALPLFLELKARVGRQSKLNFGPRGGTRRLKARKLGYYSL